VLVYGEPMVSPVKVAGYQQIGYLVFNQAGPAGAESITRAAFAFLPIPDISTPGLYGVSGMVAQADTYRWLWLFGMLGASILVFSTMLGAVDVFLTQARGLGPLGTYRAGRPLYLWITLWNVTLPLTIASAAGAALACLLGTLYTRLNGAGSLSWQVLGQGSVVIGATLVVLALFCMEAAVRTVRRWHPVAD
jgi:hypothetical protein